jgi:hypothetical protein
MGAKERYDQKVITLAGYVIESLEELGQVSIDLAWLADQMGVSKGVLRNTIGNMRKNGLLSDIPTIDPRTGKPLSDRAANKRSQPKLD